MGTPDGRRLLFECRANIRKPRPPTAHLPHAAFRGRYEFGLFRMRSPCAGAARSHWFMRAAPSAPFCRPRVHLQRGTFSLGPRRGRPSAPLGLVSCCTYSFFVVRIVLVVRRFVVLFAPSFAGAELGSAIETLVTQSRSPPNHWIIGGMPCSRARELWQFLERTEFPSGEAGAVVAPLRPGRHGLVMEACS